MEVDALFSRRTFSAEFLHLDEEAPLPPSPSFPFANWLGIWKINPISLESVLFPRCYSITFGVDSDSLQKKKRVKLRRGC